MVFLILAFICLELLILLFWREFILPLFLSVEVLSENIKGPYRDIKILEKNILNLYAHQIYRSPIYKNKEKERTKRAARGCFR